MTSNSTVYKEFQQTWMGDRLCAGKPSVHGVFTEENTEQRLLAKEVKNKQ